MVDQYNTESVLTTSYVTQSGGPVPFRLGGIKSSTNIRKQTPESGYKTFKP